MVSPSNRTPQLPPAPLPPCPLALCSMWLLSPSRAHRPHLSRLRARRCPPPSRLPPQGQPVPTALTSPTSGPPASRAPGSAKIAMPIKAAPCSYWLLQPQLSSHWLLGSTRPSLPPRPCPTEALAPKDSHGHHQPLPGCPWRDSPPHCQQTPSLPTFLQVAPNTSPFGQGAPHEPWWAEVALSSGLHSQARLLSFPPLHHLTCPGHHRALGSCQDLREWGNCYLVSSSEGGGLGKAVKCLAVITGLYKLKSFCFFKGENHTMRHRIRNCS